MPYVLVTVKKYGKNRLIVPAKYSRKFNKNYGFYSLSIGGVPIKSIRSDGRISIPKDVVKRNRLSPNKRIKLKLLTRGKGVVRKRRFTKFSKRSAFSYPMVFSPRDIQDPDRLWKRVEAYIVRTYRRNVCIAKRLDYYREFFVKFHFVAVTTTGVIEKPVVSTEVRNVLQRNSLRHILKESEALFLKMVLILSESMRYDSFYLQTVTYEIRDLLTRNSRLNRGL